VFFVEYQGGPPGIKKQAPAPLQYQPGYVNKIIATLSRGDYFAPNNWSR
jgi:hypothetical protein